VGFGIDAEVAAFDLIEMHLDVLARRRYKPARAH
jgi:hypothetical protein